jgi:hypothetical protein
MDYFFTICGKRSKLFLNKTAGGAYEQTGFWKNKRRTDGIALFHRQQ